MKTKRIPTTQAGTLFSLFDGKCTVLLWDIQILYLIFQYYFKYLLTVVFKVL